jgi:hypothetical protein
MFLFYAKDIIRSNIETNCAGQLFSYTRQETLGPQILLLLGILCVLDILLFGLLMVLVESWYVYPTYI